MEYPNIHPAVFLSRPNRFIAQVRMEGQEVICHVKNTGRCRELLVPGAAVWLTECDRPTRKTRYDLVTVEKKTPAGSLLINMDAQAPNRIFQEWADAGRFRPGLTCLRRECTYGNSRFDFYWEDSDMRGFVEIKGVTLEENGVARFPDAPTERGVKHVEELLRAREAGWQAALCFVVQMSPMKRVEPNDATHPAFGAALRRAAMQGVSVLALECRVGPGTLQPWRSVPVVL